MKIYKLEDGKILVKAAREAIEQYIKKGVKTYIKDLNKFSDLYGVFVTLKYYTKNELRGCIGFPRGISSVKDLLVDAAISAATDDPRFPPLALRELKSIVIEVSILSEPELLNKKDLTKDKIGETIKVGRDGLIIEYGYASGLLLPVVAVEENWSSEEFLKNTCYKAGLPEDAWKNPTAKLYRFEVQAFKEKTPGGEIFEENLL
ncbi:MAG: TIGR00296 family protein [Candidatus Micrarchaeia archaeon]